ncbi:MAG TPA: ATP-binding protein, partial [Methylomirabilota bacterium]|nr:ATP-binding protein [Methylomirabilota bacterium]
MEGDQLLQEASVRGLRTLFTVSQHVTSSTANQATFLGAVTRTIAHLTVARRAAFWSLQPDSTVVVQRDAFGFSEELLSTMRERPCGPDAEGVTYDVLFGDSHWHAGRRGDDEADVAEPGLEEVGLQDGVVVPWRAGDQRLGLLGVYDSARPRGFSQVDVWVTRLAALAAGLVWQERQAARRTLELERQQARQAKEYSERTAELEKAKSNILNLAAQELRTPLGVIRDYLSLLEERAYRDPAEVGRLVPVIRAKLGDMTTLIEDMVDTARLEEGRIQLSLERLDLREVVAEWVEAANVRAGSKHWIIVQREPQPVRVMGDRLRLGNVVMNLLENAIKYSPGGGPVHCSVMTEKEAAVVRVIDRGVGIAEEDLPTLFTRFGRIVNRETSSIPGTGLGLYLSRELALMHGGDLAVESHLGVGSAFSLVLPRLPAEGEGLDQGMLPGLDARSSGYDVTRFGLSEMIRCGAAVRQAGSSSNSFEEAAAGIVQHLYEKLQQGDDGQRAGVLVRLFRARPLSRLDAERQELARRALGKRVVDASTL